MAPPERVLITGATGAVGPLVVKAFHEAGYSLRTLSLDPPRDDVPADIESLIGDITDESIVRSAMEGVQVVIHMAALLHIVNPPPDTKRSYERINVGGTASVVGAAMESDVRKIVYFSTISVYGPSNGIVVTEDSPTRPDTMYASTKLEAEKIVLSARCSDGTELGTVLRLGAVYGARVKGNYQRLVRSLARGRFVPVGSGNNRRTVVYEKDVARAALLASVQEARAGNIYNVTDGQCHSLQNIIGAMCHALGRSCPSYALPVGPVRLAAGFVEKGFRFAGLRPPVTLDAINTYMEDVAVDGSRFERELGFAPQYDLEEGWKEAIREMRRNGNL